MDDPTPDLAVDLPTVVSVGCSFRTATFGRPAGCSWVLAPCTVKTDQEQYSRETWNGSTKAFAILRNVYVFIMFYSKSFPAQNPALFIESRVQSSSAANRHVLPLPSLDQTAIAIVFPEYESRNSSRMK